MASPTLSLWKLVDSVLDQKLTNYDDILDEMKRLMDESTSRGFIVNLAPGKHGKSAEKWGRYVALDCEFVGVGPRGSRSALARVLIVNFNGHVILDEYVSPNERIIDFRTHVTGITPRHLKNAIDENTAIERIDEVINGRTVIGHAVHNDFDVIGLNMNQYDIVDTLRIEFLQELLGTKKPSLKRAAREVLRILIQDDFHDSVIDARVTMLLWKLLCY